MMKGWLILAACLRAALLALIPSLAFGQVQPSGSFTPGHALRALDPTGKAAGDAGGAAGSDTFNSGYLTEIGITNTGLPFCINDALTSDVGGYHQLCVGANALGGGLLSYTPQAGASALPLRFSINGSTYDFPITLTGILGPNSSSIGYVPAWNNTAGSLLGNTPSHLDLASTLTITGAYSAVNASTHSISSLAGTASISTALSGPQGYVQPINYWNCSDTVLAPPIGGNPSAVDCGVFYQVLGGAGPPSGSRVTLAAWTNVNAPMALTVGNDYIPGFQTTTVASANVGGSVGTKIGNLYGMASQVNLQTGGTNWNAVQGGEADVGIQTGASAAYRVGFLITAFNGPVQGSVADAGLWIKLADAGKAFLCGICFGDPGGDAWPVDTTGTIIGTYGNAGTVALGLDFGLTAFTGAALRANGQLIATALTTYASNGAMPIAQGGNGTMFNITGPGVAIANQVTSVSVVSGGNPSLSATGSDPDAALVLGGKGARGVQVIGGTGFVVGAPTGGYEGAGTINAAAAYFANGSAGVTCNAQPTANWRSVNGIVTVC